ncbi:uncharacterized protein LOC112904387 [Agrilus planipennis]|uniref:Uncharacterized protein LOC112904387 n=1 Tax=Agrilus planipennis TaxID=224129 RepID=A0A7F5QXV7_AGRPL|nr:uncharacterized protein LOC112904387 [Agrilus planipennis]
MVIADFNATLFKVNSNEKIIQKTIFKIKETLNGNAIRINENQITLQFLNTLTLINDVASVINKDVSNIIETLTFARINILHPSVLNHEQLKEQLHQIRPNEGAALPFPFDNTNIYKYYQIINPNIYPYRNGILIKLIIPLVKNIKMKLFEAYSYPVKSNDTFYHTLIPDNPYVAISDDHQWYLEIPSLEKSLRQENLTLLQNVEPQDARNSVRCLPNLLLKKSFPQECKIYTFKATEESIQQVNPFTWLVASKHPLKITYKCKGQPIKRSTIQQTSLLKISEECMCYFDNGLRITTNNKQNKIVNVPVVTPEIPQNCCKQVMRTLNQLEDDPIDLNYLKRENLPLLQTKLSNLQQKIKDESARVFTNIHSQWYFLLPTTLLGITLLALKLDGAVASGLYAAVSGRSNAPLSITSRRSDEESWRRALEREEHRSCGGVRIFPSDLENPGEGHVRVSRQFVPISGAALQDRDVSGLVGKRV